MRRSLLKGASPASSCWNRLAVLSRHVLASDSPSFHTPALSAARFSSGVGARTDAEHGPNTSSDAGAFAACATSATAAIAAYSTMSQGSSVNAAEFQPTALNPKEFVPFTLKSVHVLNHNTRIYRFQLQPGQKLGLSVASCLVTKAPIGDPGEDGKPKAVIRPYTPITQPNVEGHFDLLVKVYPNGKMSSYIDSLKPGDTLAVKGPIPKLPYSPNMKKHIGMVAGGTGITPMLQVIDAVLSDPDDFTQLSLVFANTSPADVLLKQQLDEYAAAHPNFKVFYVVDKADSASGWKGGVGYVTADLLKKALPPPSSDSLVLVCGPPGMMKHVSGDKAPDKSQGQVAGLLKSLGYNEEHVYKF